MASNIKIENTMKNLKNERKNKVCIMEDEKHEGTKIIHFSVLFPCVWWCLLPTLCCCSDRSEQKENWKRIKERGEKNTNHIEEQCVR